MNWLINDRTMKKKIKIILQLDLKLLWFETYINPWTLSMRPPKQWNIFEFLFSYKKSLIKFSHSLGMMMMKRTKYTYKFFLNGLEHMLLVICMYPTTTEEWEHYYSILLSTKFTHHWTISFMFFCFQSEFLAFWLTDEVRLLLVVTSLLLMHPNGSPSFTFWPFDIKNLQGEKNVPQFINPKESAKNNLWMLTWIPWVLQKLKRQCCPYWIDPAIHPLISMYLTAMTLHHIHLNDLVYQF